MTSYPSRIESVEQLEDLLSEPTDAAVEAMKRLHGDVLLLGVGGKMGPTLARMVKRASDQAGARRRVIGVSRFSSSGLRDQLNVSGVETIACDLMNQTDLDRLPDVPNVIYMAGMKFGATGNESLTWMMNVHVPAMVCRRFARSKIVAFSSGNVYGLTPVSRGGSLESDPLRPVGEYAMTAVGRERMFEHFSRVQGTPTVLLRLNYANELRYGTLVDLANSVWNAQPIDLVMGHFNAIWQWDANAMSLAAFDHVASPPRVLNIAGPEILSVRTVAEDFGRRLGKRVTLHGNEANDALLSNSTAAQRLFGRPRVGPEQMIEWIAHWIRAGGASLGKPTHFENRAGDF
jgi:nucleoside-diphosphate-sugar epimerase